MRRRSRLLSMIVASGLAVGAFTAMSTGRVLAAVPNEICATGFDGVTICATGALQIVPVGGTGANVTFTCSAYTNAPVLDTNVDCSASGSGTTVSARNVWAPGDAAATAGDSGATIVPLQPYQLCIKAEYVNLQGQRGSGSNDLATLTGCINALP